MKKIINLYQRISFSNIFVILILVISLRGIFGIPQAEELITAKWREDGPFELSPERGRFALTYSIIEDRSLEFSADLARFVVPDLGYVHGKYVSLFAPGVSFIVLPGYVIGKAFGASQAGTFMVVSVFAFLNYLLIKKISILLGSNRYIANLAGLVFLFATPAYAYAVNLYQHHISTFLILMSVYLLVKFNDKWISLFSVFFLCALGIAVDNPNFFMMFPLGLYALAKSVGFIEKKSMYKISLKFGKILAVIGVIVPVIFYLTFNKASYGNPLQLSGTVASVVAIDEYGYPALPENVKDDPELLKKALNPDKQEKSSVGFFSPRAIVNGLYIHIFSEDRGILFYTPIILFGAYGIFVLYRKSSPYLALLLGIGLSGIILYSMWGDPWGGWAFGSRYMIPVYSIFAIFLSIAITNLPRIIFIKIIMALIIVYSLGINTLGAITTSALPPKVQVPELSKVTGRVERYTPLRNWDYLNSAGSKSFVYREFARTLMPASIYYAIIIGLLSSVSLGLLFYGTRKTNK